jgi:thiamine-phosphate pyrophosphorylase
MRGVIPPVHPIVPVIYPILDVSFLPANGRASFLDQLGRSLTDAGVTMLEYRNKPGSDAEVLADARILRAAMPRTQVRLILDDRVDVALAAGFDGAHVDTGDMPPADARHLMGGASIIGTSASDETNLGNALTQPVDYIAFGPIFPTTTKQTSAQPIGIEGVHHFRNLAGPEAVLVAAAGITLETAPAILAAGASSVAVASAIFRTADPAAEFRRWIANLN